MYRFSSTQQKIMVVLLGGVALGCSYNSRQYYKTLRNICKAWKHIDQGSFNRSIRRLSKEKLVKKVKMKGGSFKLELTERGKKQASFLQLMGNTIKFKKPKKWDKKWRLVMFDVPEKDRLFRDILRKHLKELQFKKLQHSVFVSPYPFEKPILELVDLYSASKYVRVVTATKLDNEKQLKQAFLRK